MRNTALLLVIATLGACPDAGVDLDLDGVDAALDCDDDNATVYPDAVELCDGLDNNCDGAIDDGGNEDAALWFTDQDADGFGTADSGQRLCIPPLDGARVGGDCDDADPAVFPGQPGCLVPGASSCADLLASAPAAPPGTFPSGVYALGASDARVYCDMSAEDPGWTLLLKTDGASNEVFAYDDPRWTNEELLAPELLDAEPANAKFATFVDLPIAELRGCFADVVGGCFAMRWTARSTALAHFQGEPDLIDSQDGLPAGLSIQDRCPTFGVNTPYPWQRVRFGFTGNNEDNCTSNDSSVGFGIGQLDKDYGSSPIAWGAGENCTASRCTNGSQRRAHPGLLWGR